jgi:hypothetical protein
MHRDHLGDACRALATFNLNCDSVGDPQAIGRRIICRDDGNPAA